MEEDDEKNLSDWDDDSEPENISSFIRQKIHHNVARGLRCTNYESSKADHRAPSYKSPAHEFKDQSQMQNVFEGTVETLRKRAASTSK